MRKARLHVPGMPDREPAVTTPWRSDAARAWRTSPAPDVLAFHRSLPGYAPTRLVAAPALAHELGIATVHIKEESARFGLPAFKMLGASYAISKALATRLGLAGAPPFDALRTRLAATGTVQLVAATDGNHGRAVARSARLLGAQARIFVPAGISAVAKDGIRSEGAELVVLDARYDDVVTAAAAAAAQRSGALLIQDTAWEGYAQIPAWIVEGYSTLLREADRQLEEAGAKGPDLVVVPMGVGSLAAAVVRHYRSGACAPSILGVEPVAAAALLTSLHLGRAVSIDTGDTVMAGLNCGTPTASGWATLQAGMDGALAVSDADAIRAVHDLEQLGIDAGPCGAATLAGIRSLATGRPLERAAHVVLLSTESRAANPLRG